MLEIKIEDCPLSVNASYKFNKNGRCYKSKRHIEKAKIWKTELLKYQDQKIYGKVKITFEFTKKGKRKFDLDNLIKFSIDQIMNCCIIDDDECVFEISAKKYYGSENKTFILIESIYD